MDQRAGEKEEHNSEDSWDHRRKDDVDAAAEGLGINNHGVSSMGHQSDGAGHEEAEDETLKEVEVVGGGSDEEASAPPLLAHPCSLLQLLLRACAGCLSLYGYGYCCDDDDDVAAAAATDSESPQEGDHQGGGDKAAGDFCMQEVDTQVRAARRRPPPPPSGRPREGPGGNGGNHH